MEPNIFWGAGTEGGAGYRFRDKGYDAFSFYCLFEFRSQPVDIRRIAFPGCLSL